jgi:hypothetical protein
MAVDADGAVHIAWTHSEAGLSQFNYINRSTDGTWSAIQQIPVLSPSFSNPRIGVDSSGRVHVIWIEHMAEWEGRVVYARREATGQWSTPGVISNTPPLYGTFAPHLLVSPEGSVHVFWYEKSEHWNHELMRILYRQMRGDGSWQEPQLLANPHKYSNFHLLAKLTQGHLHLVWEEDVKQEVEWQRGIYYRQRDALGNWSDPPQLLSLYHNIGDMAVSETSDLHLLLRRSNDSQIFLMTQRQGGWSLPEPLSDDPIYGRAAITLDDTGTLHVAWVRSNHGVSTPYYQRRTADGSWLPARQLASPVMNMQKIDVASGSGLLHIVWNGDSGLQAISSVTSDGEISTLSQQVTIPAEMASPTLSLQYNGDGFGPQNQPRFTVQVSDAISTATLLSAEENSDGWTHHWRDLSAWQGRPVTVTLRLDQPANQPCASVLVDEVTLGTAYPDLWIRGGNAFSAMPGQPVQYILDYGNRGGGRSSARIHATLPPQVQLVDSSPPATINGNRLSWEILDITERSKSGQIIIKGMVSSGTALMSEVTLAVHIESPLPEPEQSNNKMDLSTFIGNRLLLPVVHR